MDLVALYCSIDDFYKEFEKDWNQHLIEKGIKPRGPKPSLSIPEMMTIVIYFHQSNFRTFKKFYFYLRQNHLKDFPDLISYCRFVYLMKNLFIPLYAYLISQKGKCSGIAFIDATTIKVCHNKRISRNKVFDGIAKTGKSTMGWFHGFKLHIVVNDQGEILSFLLTPGNVSDISVAEELCTGLYGKVFADKGYISTKLFQKLMKKGVQIITGIRKRMKSKLMDLQDKILLRKRSIVETVNDQLKNISQIEHTRHRSICNFLINILSGLSAYSLQEKKPSLNCVSSDNLLPIAA